MYKQNGMTDEEMFELLQKKQQLFEDQRSEEQKEQLRKFAEADAKASEWEKYPEGTDLKTIRGDARYNVPKEKPKFSQEEIDAVIGNNPIYKEVKLMLLDEQRGQVGYGMGKYPEPLNDETWGIIETLDHMISEDIDKLHYSVMLKIKLTKLLKMIGGEKR